MHQQIFFSKKKKKNCFEDIHRVPDEMKTTVWMTR